MDRTSVSRLAALALTAMGVAGCEAPRNDGAMFQRWAQAVQDIPLDERGAAKPRSDTPGAPRRMLPEITLSAEAAGLRAPMKVAVVDPLEMPNSRDLGLRLSHVADVVLPRDAEEPRLERTAHAAAGGYAAQLASFRSRADAEAAWAALSRKHARLFADVTPRFQTVDLGARGTWVRLQAAGLSDPQAALRICAAAGVTDAWCVKGGASS